MPPPSATRTTSGASASSSALQVAAGDGGEEALHDLLLLAAADLHPRPSGGDVLAGPVADLAYGGRGLVDRLGDLGVRDVEDLAEHEHRALGRGQRLEHGEHRVGDAVRQLDVVGHVGRGQQRLGQPLADVLLAPARVRTEPVERLARDHPDQEGARVADLAARLLADRVPADPRLLHDVLRLGGGAEHLVGDREEQSAVRDERVHGHDPTAVRASTASGAETAGVREAVGLDAERDVGAGREVGERDHRGQLEHAGVAELGAQRLDHLVGHRRLGLGHRLGVREHVALQRREHAGLAPARHLAGLVHVEVAVVGLEVVEVEAPGAADLRRDGHVRERLELLVAPVPLLDLLPILAMSISTCWWCQ